MKRISHNALDTLLRGKQYQLLLSQETLFLPDNVILSPSPLALLLLILAIDNLYLLASWVVVSFSKAIVLLGINAPK